MTTANTNFENQKKNSGNFLLDVEKKMVTLHNKRIKHNKKLKIKYYDKSRYRK